MTHFTHKLKAYTADPRKPLVFCCLCGKEEDEGLSEPCAETFYQMPVDIEAPKVDKKFVSGLP